MAQVHGHLVAALSDSVDAVFFGDKHAEKVVDGMLFKNKKWGARDRRFFAESLYGMVRWWRKIWDLLDLQPAPGQAVLVWQVFWFLEHGDWVDVPGLERFELSGISPELQKKVVSRRKLSRPRSVEQSIPDWLDAMGAADFADRWPEVLKALNSAASVDLRVNPLLSSVSEVQKLLLDEEIETQVIPDLEGALSLMARKNVFATKAFKSGLFEVQDRGSQMIGDLLPVKPGDRVVDACAGAGGKTLQLAAKLKNKGKIIALDIHEWKLNELRKRASRAQVALVETRLLDSTKVIKRLVDSADAVLLDVPCSGLGVLRRHPDTKWKMNPDEIQRLQSVQLDLLKSYSRMAVAGGHLVYATCSWLSRENDQIVEEFLKAPEGASFKILKTVHLDPARHQSDGFFGCLLQKSL